MTSTPEAPPAARSAGELLRRRAAEQPDGVAFMVDGTAELRYGDWERRSTGVANGLLASGAVRGTRVGLVFGGLDWVDYAVAYFGVLKAGCVAVHVSPKLPPEELARRLEEAGASRLIGADGAAVSSGFPAAGVARLERGGDEAVDVDVGPEDLADVLFTSGTTGPAKAYGVPHGNLVYDRRLGSMDAFVGAQHMVVGLPLGTGSSAGAVNVATVSPFVAVLCAPGDVERLGNLVARFRAGMVGITPWTASRMVAERLHERHDLSSVHTFANGSGPLPPALANALLAMVPGARVSSACSQSEAAPALVVNVFDPAHPTRAGRPAPGTEVRIAGDHGERLAPGEVGEIWLRSPAPKRLYLHRPHENARILADGWYRTGDLGHVDAEGWLHFFDRRADAVTTGAGLVSSLHVEAALFEAPGVRDAVAFGIPGDGEAERVAAAVVLGPGAKLAPVEAHLAARLAPAEVPVELEAVDALPRNAHGKVLKHRLRERHGTPLGLAASAP